MTIPPGLALCGGWCEQRHDVMNILMVRIKTLGYGL